MANEISIYTHDGMEIPVEDWSKSLHSFSDLASVIQVTHDSAQSSAIKAINRMQTMRNWLIGYYIVEFEQHGKDRAEYGAQLLKRLKEKVNRKGLNETLFKNSRSFYLAYPQIADNITQISPTASDKLANSVSASREGKMQQVKNQPTEISPTPSDQFNPTLIIKRNFRQFSSRISL